MIRKIVLAAALGVAVWASGCNDERAEQPPQPAAGPSTKPAEEDDHGREVELGTQATGGLTVKVSGTGLEAGEEAHLDVTVTGGEKPKAIRAWVGVESAEGSVKAKAKDQDAQAGDAHLHVDVPSPLPPGSKVWVEVETSTGTYKASFDIKK